MNLMADIASGNTDTADVLFLIAAIVFGLATLAAAGFGRHAEPWTLPLLAAGACLASIAWLLL